MVHIVDFIFPIIIAVLLFVVGILGLSFFKRRVNYTRSLVLILASYGLIASEFFIFFYSVSHFHSWYKFHFHIPTLGDHDYFSTDNPIDLPSIFILTMTFTALIFILAIFLSQISLRIMVGNLTKKLNMTISDDLKVKYSWLPKEYHLMVINDDQFDAFTFTLLKNKGLRLRAENWIIITNGLLEMLSEDEIEMVLAHEYSHTAEYDTRYSHLIFTIASIIFFDPMLKLLKYIIHENHEYNADLHAVKLIGKPRALANALLKMLKKQITIKNMNIAIGIISTKKPFILRRIEKLIEYAELHKL